MDVGVGVDVGVEECGLIEAHDLCDRIHNGNSCICAERDRQTEKCNSVLDVWLKDRFI